MKHFTSILTLGVALSAAALAAEQDCKDLPSAAQLKAHLNNLNSVSSEIGGTIGGLFNGARMWAAVVNRNGEVCAVAASTNDPTQVWPGSQAIAKAKAYTANAFSLDDFALSTARLYTFTQPGHSLWSLGQSNLFDPSKLAAPGDANKEPGKIAGGLIFFGGGVPLYRNGKIAGGLGISGDTSCADHEVAKRVRALAAMNPAGGAKADDIKYSAADGAGPFTHPLCINTYRNGDALGTEANSSGY
ncbi:MAG: heme-binding protein [Bryobacteraceae bacterium]